MSLLDRAVRGTFAPPTSPLDRAIAAQNAQGPGQEPGLATGGSFTRGVTSGVQGLMGATRSFGGALAGAAGYPETAKGLYDAAAEDAATAQRTAPEVQRVQDIHSPGQALSYGLGAVGQGLPALAPALAGGGLARAAGAGPTGAFLGGAAPLFPSMAGSAVERMRADPATANLPPQELLGRAAAEGAVNTGIGEAVPYAMQGRALGQAGLAARATLHPLRSIAADTAMGGLGMGASNVAMGEVSRAAQRQLDPAYQQGQDNDERLNEFASGVPLGAAAGLPHAAVAHTFGSAVDGVRSNADIVKSGVKQAGAAAVDLGGKAVDAVKGAVGAGDEPPGPPDTRTAGQKVKDAGEAFDGFVKSVFGDKAKGKTVDDGLGNLAAEAHDAALDDDVPHEVGKGIFDKLGTLLDELGNAPAADELQGLYKKFRESPTQFSTEDYLATARAIKDLTLHGVDGLINDTPQSNTPESDAPLSESHGDRGFKIAHEYLKAGGVPESLAERIANQMQMRQILAPGVTKHLNDLHTRMLGIVANDTSMHGQPPEVVTHMYQRVRELLEKSAPEYQKAREEAAKKTDQLIPQDPERLRGSVREAVHELLRGTGMEQGDTFERAVDGVTNTVMHTAAGTKGHQREISRLAEGIMKHGDKGEAFLDKITAAAQVEFGHDSAAVKRLDRLGDGARGLKDSLGTFHDSLKDRQKPGQLLGTMRKFLGDFRDARANDMTPLEAAKRIEELRVKMREASKNAGDYKLATRYGEEAMALKRRMQENKSPMQEFVDAWSKKFKGTKQFYRALDAAVQWERSKQDTMPTERVGGNPDAVSRTGIRDDENSAGATQGTAEHAGGEAEDGPIDVAKLTKFGDDLDALHARVEENEGHQGGTESARTSTSQYHGESTLRGVHDEHAVSAPVTPMRSGDFPSGMGAAMLDRMRAVWGDKRVAELRDRGITSMKDWAADMSERTGRSTESLLSEAMDRLLEHDNEREQRMAANPKRLTKEGGDNRAAVEEAQHWIDQRRQQAQALEGNPNRGTIFFNSKTQRHYGYYKLEGASGANVEVTAADLTRYSPKVVDGQRVSADTYARRQAARENTNFADVAHSMLTVDTKDGPVPVDVARMLRDQLYRHQQADTIGVEERQGSTQQGDLQTAPQNYTPKELGRALMNLMGALKTGEGVTGMKMPDPATLVVWREPGQAPKTMRDVTGILKFGKDGKPVRDVRRTEQEDLDRIVKDQARLAGTDKDGRSLVHDERDQRDREAKPGDQPTTNARLNNEAVRNATTDAKKGELRNFYPGRNVDAHALLQHMAELHGVDQHDLSRMPVTHAAALMVEGLKMLREKEGDNPLVHREGTKTGEVKTFPKESTRKMFDPGDARNAWENAVVYTRNYGKEEYPVTLKELLNADRIKGAPLHDVDSFRVAEARHVMKQADEERAASAERRASGNLDQTKDFGNANIARGAATTPEQAESMRAERDQLRTKMEEGKLQAGDAERLRVLERNTQTAHERDVSDRRAKAADDEANALGHMDDSKTRDLLHSDSEPENYRVQAILREHKDATGETPVFDRFEARTSEDRAKKETVSELRERQAQNEADNKSAAANERAARNAPKAEAEVPKTAAPHPQGDQRTVAEAAAAARSAEGVGSFAGEVNPKRGSGTAKQQAEAQKIRDDFAARRKDITDRWNKRVAERADKALQQASNKSRVDSLREQLEAKARSKYAKTSEEMGGNAADLSRDVPFSESTGDSRFSAENEEALKGELKKLVGDLADLKLTDEDIGGKGAAGMWEKAKKLISVSMFHGDQRGVLHHEAWHAVEDFLKEMGPKGQRILDTVYKHVDSPLMRKRLEELYKSDAGAVNQIRTGDQKERAAYAFQAHMRGESLPVAHETKTFFGRIKDFLISAARKLGFAGNEKLTNNFFDFVKSGDFARDKDNPHAVERGLGETGAQRVINDVAGGLKPLREAYTALMEHTGTRLLSHNVDEYKEIHDLYAGPAGKGGYSDILSASRVRFGNMLADAFHGDVRNDDAFSRFTDSFSKYLSAAGLSDKEIARINKTVSYDTDAIYKNFGEFEHDLAQHGGLDAKEAREVAQHLLDHGFIERDKELFADKPEIAKKWLDKDSRSSAGRIVYNGTKAAERRRAFDEKDERGNLITNGKVDRLLAAGDKKASAEGRAMARRFIDSFEGTVGHGTLSPSAEAVMGVILTVNNLRLLPLSLFSQMIEPAQLAFRKNDMNAAWSALGRGIKDLPRSAETFDKAYNKDYFERLAEDVGTVASSAAGGMVAGLHANGITLRGKVNKINDLFFKYNGMDQWNRSMHIAATKMGVEFLKDHAAGISKHSERFLSELKLKADDVQLDADGNLKRNAKIDRALVQYVNESMAHPDAGSNPYWMNDPRYALFAQMKKFNWAHSYNVLKRAKNELKHGNFDVFGPAALAVGFMASADWLKHALNPMATGETMDSHASALEYAQSRLERAGMFGRQALFMDVEKNVRMGGTGLDPILGPSADLFSRIAHGYTNHNVLETLLGNGPGPHTDVMAD